MPFMQDSGESRQYEIPPHDLDGMPGRIVRVDYVGKQDDSYQGESKVRAKVALTIELDPEHAGQMTDGSPFDVVRAETVSTHTKAHLRRYLSWTRPEWDDDTFKAGLEFADIRDALQGCCVLVPVKRYQKNDGNEGASIQPLQRANPKFVQPHTIRGDYSEPSGLIDYFRSKAVDKAGEPWVAIESIPASLGGSQAASPQPVQAPTGPATTDTVGAAQDIEFNNKF